MSLPKRLFALKMRLRPTPAERAMWRLLKRRYSWRLLYGLQRQRVIRGYIADIVLPRARLIIELDGAQHYTANGRSSDAFRTSVLEKAGYVVVRIPNATVLRKPAVAMLRVETALQGRGWWVLLHPRARGRR